MKGTKEVGEVSGDKDGKSWEDQEIVKLELENYVFRYLCYFQ